MSSLAQLPLPSHCCRLAKRTRAKCGVGCLTAPCMGYPFPQPCASESDQIPSMSLPERSVLMNQDLCDSKTPSVE